jgi:RNA polymerase sigma-70 factor (ECF subfamily)
MQEVTSTFGLITRVKAGDQEAFTRLFDKYRRRLAVLLHYKMSDELRIAMEVDDLLQETFLRAFRDVQQFTYRSPGSFLRWLASIADHVVIDAARTQGRFRRDGVMLAFRSRSNPAGPEPRDSRTPSRLMAERQALDGMLARLNTLPSEYRQVILWAKMEGLSTKEMAERLGRSREATALLLHRALKRFRVLAKS